MRVITVLPYAALVTLAVTASAGLQQATAASKPAASASVRSDSFDIPLAPGGDAKAGDELEFKVHMKAGAKLTYAWHVEGLNDPKAFYYDFHSEAPVPGQKEPKVAEHKKAIGASAKGVLITPFTGIHGWYLQNQSTKPVVVKLKLSGVYDLIPDGQDGNERGIEPTPKH